MFVKNYKAIRKFLQLGYFQRVRINYADILNKLGGMKSISGKELNSENGFYTWTYYTYKHLFAYNKNNIFNLCNHQNKYGTNGKTCNYLSGLYLALGNGTGELNEEDYTLFTPLTYSVDYEAVDNDKIVSNLNEDGTMNQITLTYCFKALKDITITETGLMHCVNSDNNGDLYIPYLLSHEMLDEPMTFTEGELFSITYTVEIPVE